MAKKNPNITSVEFKSHKKEYEEALEEIAEKVLTMWGMEAETAAKYKAPVDTGLLRNSITWAVAGESPKTSRYQSNGRHAETEATKRAGTAGKKISPIITGQYSGKAKEDPNGKRHVYIGTNVEYAIAQENGDFYDGPHAFLRPAIDENRDHFRQILEEELKNAMNGDD